MRSKKHIFIGLIFSLTPIILIAFFFGHVSANEDGQQLQYTAFRQCSDTACEIFLDAMNPTDERSIPDFNGTSGPGFVDWAGRSAIKLADVYGNDCDAVSSMPFEGVGGEVPAHGSLRGRVKCNNDASFYATKLTVFGESVHIK